MYDLLIETLMALELGIVGVMLGLTFAKFQKSKN